MNNNQPETIADFLQELDKLDKDKPGVAQYKLAVMWWMYCVFKVC